jgi:hypothetical protein
MESTGCTHRRSDKATRAEKIFIVSKVAFLGEHTNLRIKLKKELIWQKQKKYRYTALPN